MITPFPILVTIIVILYILSVIDPRQAVVEVSDYIHQTSQFAQTTLLAVLANAKINYSYVQYFGEVRSRLTALLIAHPGSPFQNRLEARIVGEARNAPYNLC